METVCQAAHRLDLTRRQQRDDGILATQLDCFTQLQLAQCFVVQRKLAGIGQGDGNHPSAFLECQGKTAGTGIA